MGYSVNTVQYMLKISTGRRDLVIALAGRITSTFGDEVALVALTLRLQADGAQPYEVGLLLAAGVIPLLFLSRPVGRLADSHDSRYLLVGAGLIEVACTLPLILVHSVVAIVVLVAVLGAAASVTASTWAALVPRIVGEEYVAKAVAAQQSLSALVLVGRWRRCWSTLDGGRRHSPPRRPRAESQEASKFCAAIRCWRRSPSALGWLSCS